MNKHTSFQTRAQRVNKLLCYCALVLLVLFAYAAQASAQTCTPVRPNLVSWWSGDGNALDSRSRNNGTLMNGATFAAGKVGQAFSFDGVDDLVNVADAPTLHLQTFTIDAWVNPTDLTQDRAILIKSALSSGGNDFAYGLRVLSGGHAEGRITDGGASASVVSTSVLSTNQFQQIALTYDGAALRLYVNGVLDATTATNLAPVQNTNPVSIGAWQSVSAGVIQHWVGVIDETELFNRALSQTEIQAIFNAGTAGKCKPTATVAPAGQIGWWAGDGNANDISGSGIDGALQGGAGFAVGEVSQAFSFNAGANSGVVVPSNSVLSPAGGVTLEAWVKPSTFPNLGPAIIRRDTNGGGTTQYSLNAGDGITTGVVHCNIGGTAGVTGGSVPLNVWSHVACTYDLQFIRAYVNGVEVASIAATLAIPVSSQNLAIGKEDGFTDRNFDGLIDEASIYNRGLTQDEITSIFNAGLAGKLKIGTTTGPGSNVSTNLGSDATLTFPTVNTTGTTQQIPLDPSALPALPGGFTQTGLTYDIATAAAVSGNINIRFHLPCFTTSSQFNFLKVLHLEGGVWVDRTVAKDFGTSTLTASVSSLSPFVIANGSSPTAVTLGSFTAKGYDKGVLLEWQTGYEADNLGFRLYRQEGGQRTLVSPQLIAGSALTAGSTLLAGQGYVWWDIGIVDCGSRIENCRNVAYWLEAIDLKGQSSWHGPFLVQQGKGAPPSRSQAALLGALGKTQADSTRPVEMTASPIHASAEQIRLQSSLAAESGVKIAVKREGWYRVTQPELAAAGFDTKVNSRLLQVFVDGNQLPIVVRGEQDGSFDAGDSVEFYGIGVDSPFTDSRVYWLVAGDQSGLRINQAKSEGTPSPSRNFTYTVERRDRNIYFSGLRNGEKENFFGAVVGHNPVDQDLMVVHLAQADSAQAQLEITLQGVTFGDHHVGVRLNGLSVGELTFHDQAQGSAKFAVANSILREGGNVVQLTSLSGESDISLVDHLRVSYQHSYTADNDALKLTATANQLVTIDGFRSKYVRVFDVTDSHSPEELLGEVKEQKSGYAVTFASPGQGQRELIAFTTEQRPASMALNKTSNLRNGAASYIIITRAEFGDALRPLVALRQKQGLSVSIVDIEDIYDEFSFGQKSPYAVRDFLSYAKSNWKKKPRFVLFAGDASFDPKNYLGFGDSDLVPTKLIDTGLMETSSDDWLSDFDVDGIADIATGRLPARTVEELSRMVAKIITYEQGAPSEEALLVADANEGFDFEQASAELRSLIPDNLRITQVDRGRLDPEMARSSLFEALYRKQFLVNYAGHGSVNQWRGNLLTNDDALTLRNEHLPMFVMMTCLNGYFHDPALDSLAESLLKAERGGAVAVWASSGMTFPADQALLNQELYRLLFNRGEAMTIGEAVKRTKVSLRDADIRRTWILLGDPAMKLR